MLLPILVTNSTVYKKLIHVFFGNRFLWEMLGASLCLVLAFARKSHCKHFNHSVVKNHYSAYILDCFVAQNAPRNNHSVQKPIYATTP